MIHRLTIENFRSFNEKVELDFTAAPKKAGLFGYAETKSGEVVSRVNMLIGPNASGKSNVLKALATLAWVIGESAEQNANRFDYLFQFHGNNEPIRLGIECSDELTEELFRYEVAIFPNPILFAEERLSVRATKRSQWETIFDRKIKKESVIAFAGDDTREWSSAPQRANASLIGSRILAGSVPNIPSRSLDIAHRLQSIAKNFFGNVAAEFEDNQRIPAWDEVGRKLNDNKELGAKITDFAKNADIGVTKFGTQKINVNNPRVGLSTVIIPAFMHAIGEKNISLNYNLESVGTRVILALLTEAFPVAEKSGVIALDEIERGIHPHLLPEIVRALTPGDTTSQLFLVSHCDYLLRHLEHDQVFLAEKQDDGSTDIYRADDFKDLKADRNLLNWYHAGKLGAIPNR